MTKKELDQQCRDFQISSRKLANTLQKLKASIQKIESDAQANQGELTQEEAYRHTKLQKIMDKTYEDIAGTLALFP
jgi:peptidoglycan hydrolase CwlO-like protein